MTRQIMWFICLRHQTPHNIGSVSKGSMLQTRNKYYIQTFNSEHWQMTKRKDHLFAYYKYYYCFKFARYRGNVYFVFLVCKQEHLLIFMTGLSYQWLACCSVCPSCCVLLMPPTGGRHWLLCAGRCADSRVVSECQGLGY